MATNRILLKLCVASLALFAAAASAQTIYKQVDADGRVMFTDQPNPAARVVASYEPGRVAVRAQTQIEDSEAAPTTAIPDPVSHLPAPGAGRSRNDVERAVFSYASLDSPLAMQVDGLEAARRARLEAYKDAKPAGVLIVKPVPRGHEPSPQRAGTDAFYMLWVATFFVLAAGLLFVGWQTIRLVLRGGFPRWQAGSA